MNTRDNNKRIAQNTLLLYIRMLLLMLVSLYTSRINLNALGIEDFGIYGVVGGLVSMFYIISNALTGSISRYLTFELGRNNQKQLNRIFSTSITIQYALVGIIFIVGETIGLWFLNNKMIVPTERLYATNWVYQLSLLSFMMDLLVIPYTATIIAHEKMSAFAYISILQALGKLIIAWSISTAPIDRLIWFSSLILCNATIIRSVYIFYCKHHFEECCSKFTFDKPLWKEMFGFAGWNFIGSIASILRDYGGNIIINIFSGPTVNAARSIAIQVNGAVAGFADNFQTALKPQITKNYAQGNYDYMYKLIFQGARLSYYILFIFALPIICNTHYILQLWLGQVPAHTELFVQLVLIFTMSESLANPLITAMLATGKIRNFQIIVGGLNLLNLPLSYVVLQLGGIPETVMIVAIFISILCEIARILLLHSMIGLPAYSFFRHVYLNVIMVSITAGILPMWLHKQLNESFITFIIVSLIAFTCSMLSILFVGCNKKERTFIFKQIKNNYNKLKNNLF